MYRFCTYFYALKTTWHFVHTRRPEIHTCIRVLEDTHTHTNKLYICMHACVYLCIYVHTYVYIYIYIYIYMHTHTQTQTNTHVNVYIHTHTNTPTYTRTAGTDGAARTHLLADTHKRIRGLLVTAGGLRAHTRVCFCAHKFSQKNKRVWRKHSVAVF